jgi:type II secretory ATPase GspE/PulE/Tfp pilus assembly ATPase PilB-like protein
LVRRVCPHCAEAYTPTEADLRVLGLDREQMLTGTWQRGRGCSMCFNSGYLGREALVELLDIDDTVRELIYEGTMSQLHRYLRETNFASFRIGAIEKVTSGLTTVEEVLRVIPRSALHSKVIIKIEQLSLSQSVPQK